MKPEPTNPTTTDTEKARARFTKIQSRLSKLRRMESDDAMAHAYVQDVSYLLARLAKEREAIDPCYLDCAICDASEAFVISKQDPSTGYCFAEKREWTLKTAKEIVRNYYKCDECGTEYTSISNQCSSGCVNERITVCDKCLQASCWQGKFMCQESQNAGTIEMTRGELLRLGREHPDHFTTKALEAARNEGNSK